MMLPPVMPNVRSRSSGESTCRCSIALGTFGAYSASTSMQRSANFSLMSSQLPLGQFVRRVLHEHAEDVLARRGDRAIDAGGHRDFEDRPLARAGRTWRRRTPARGSRATGRCASCRDGAGRRRSRRQAGELRRLGQGEVDLRRGRRVVDPRDGFAKILGQLVGREKLLERQMGVDAGGDDVGVELRAVFEPHADRAAVVR